MSQIRKTLNILILGETGVGKSTFINAFANYITYKNLDDAMNDGVQYAVPSKFILLDDNLNETEIKLGSSSNELQQTGVSGTQQPTSYYFEIKDENINVRIIDTPGIGDTRGIEYDERNTENLLTFIGELDYLNAICIFLKPDNSRLSVLFNYCIKHILFRLDQKIRSNILFVFTNARSSFYTPGETIQPLQVILDEIENRKSSSEPIPLNSQNTFCVENESFRYLVAKSSGYPFSQSDVDVYKESWNRSTATCKRFVKYIDSLQQMPMQGIVSVNESRRIVGRLAKPVIEMMVLHQKAVIVIDEHEVKLNSTTNSIDDLRKSLYTPVSELIVGKKTVYSQTKHTAGAGVSLSLLPPFVTVNLTYKYSKDERIEEHLVSVEKMVEDQKVKAMILTEENALEVRTKQLEAMKNLVEEYKREERIILTSAAIFTKFLQENAILFGSDPLELYLKNILKEEEEADGNPKLIEKLKSLLMRYQVKKDYTFNVSPKDVQNKLNDLLKLKHSGKSLKYFYEKKYIFDDQRPIKSVTSN